MVRRRNVIIGALGAAAGLTAAGCSTPSHAKGSTAAAADNSPVGTWNSPSVTPVSLTVTPRAGAAKVLPTEAVTVSVAGGTLDAVTVAAGSKKLSGSVQSDGVTWKSTGTMAYGTTYKVTASVVDATGAKVEKTSTFATLKPKAVAAITFQANGMGSLKTGGTYGVGQPVIVAFSKAITDKAAAEKAITIETTPEVPGKFFWVSSTIVHWRPAKYWAKGTTIKVNVDSLGVHLGNGVYGRSNSSTHFTIGRKLVAISDNNTHHTKVYIDGAMVRDMASSNGKGGYTTITDGTQIHFWTQNGPHVVLSKERTHTMSSASYGLSDPTNPHYYAPEVVEYCTRISYSGEFLHAAPWNHSLGKANISHGCVNLGEADAKWVYENFLVGDVVEVNHSPKSLPVWDGLGDWNVAFDKYGH
ncbi:Ig-like domain-containing protein [Actinoplanes sp. NPDC026619]|uniref:L,D-transpeptidase n=1 Tax=Actinoplanes sp. NPDC026619 TaxID=3155798 RepID=UPI0033DB23AE